MLRHLGSILGPAGMDLLLGEHFLTAVLKFLQNTGYTETFMENALT
jgi:hypothetical protein